MTNFTSECQRRVLAELAGGDRLTTVGLALKTGLGLRSTAGATSLLLLRGLVERSQEGDFAATPEGLAFHQSGAPFRPGPVRPHHRVRPKPKTFIQRIWTSMRLRRRFTLDDIVTTVAMSGDTKAYGTVQRYIHALRKAGYVATLSLRTEPTRPTSNGCLLLSLVRDTGDLAPALRRDGSVFDRNERGT